MGAGKQEVLLDLVISLTWVVTDGVRHLWLPDWGLSDRREVSPLTWALDPCRSVRTGG